MPTSPEQIASEMAAGSELARLRRVNAELVAACENSSGLLCLMVGDLRDRGLPHGAAILQEALDRLRAALSTSKER